MYLFHFLPLLFQLECQLLVLPQVSSDPVAGNDLVRKSHLDTELATAAADVTALEGRVQAIEDDYGVAGGLATLDGSGKIPSSQVPPTVDPPVPWRQVQGLDRGSRERRLRDRQPSCPRSVSPTQVHA